MGPVTDSTGESWSNPWRSHPADYLHALLSLEAGSSLAGSLWLWQPEGFIIKQVSVILAADTVHIFLSHLHVMTLAETHTWAPHVKIWGGHDNRAHRCSCIQGLRAEVRACSLYYSVYIWIYLCGCLIPCFFIHSANSHEEADSSGAVNHSEDESGNENRRRSAVSDSTGRGGEEDERDGSRDTFVFF